MHPHSGHVRTTDGTPLNIIPRLHTSHRLALLAVATLLLLVYCGRTELSPEEQDEREIEALVACQDEFGRRLRLHAIGGGDWEPDRVTYLGEDRYRVDSYVEATHGEGTMRRIHFTCGVVHTDQNEWRIYSLDRIP